MDENTISISDLKGEETIKQEVPVTKREELTPVDISTMAPKAAPELDTDKFMDEALDELDTTSERIKKEAIDFAAQRDEEIFNAKNKIDLAAKNEEFDDEEDIKEEKEAIHYSTNFSFDDNDFDNDDDDEDKNEDEEKQINEIKSEIKEKIKPIASIIDLKSFTISKKPATVVNTLNKAASTKHVIDWALPAAGRSFSIESFDGFDIEKLNPKSAGRNRFNMYKDIYTRIYSHIVDANKCANVETWIKTLNFYDITHLYFGIYKASFEGSNYIPYKCEDKKCNHVFMSEKSINSMVKYKNETAEKKMKDLLAKDTTTEYNSYEVEMIQASDTYVIGLREPSVFNVIFENSMLDEAISEKYNELLGLITYVDCIYYINRETNELQPIELKVYENNSTKTIMNKVRKYAEILKTLSSDQFHQFNAYINAINVRHDDITYVIPECECPKCKKIIPEVEQSGESLLFTRHQLAGIVTT